MWNVIFRIISFCDWKVQYVLWLFPELQQKDFRLHIFNSWFIYKSCLYSQVFFNVSDTCVFISLLFCLDFSFVMKFFAVLKSLIILFCCIFSFFFIPLFLFFFSILFNWAAFYFFPRCRLIEFLHRPAASPLLTSAEFYFFSWFYLLEICSWQVFYLCI